MARFRRGREELRCPQHPRLARQVGGDGRRAVLADVNQLVADSDQVQRIITADNPRNIALDSAAPTPLAGPG
jgi:hypothetical protein